MGLFDRFRAQPRWKNANPAIRAAAVAELPLDQQDLLASIAREDRDPGVRTAALKKVISPSTIAEIGRTDSDHRVKEEAHGLLVDLANGAFEGTTEAESLAALAGLTDQKHVVSVARGAANEKVARAALERLDDQAGLGSVARRAQLPVIRLGALARIVSETEVVTVALRTEFKDVALAAVERITNQSLLEDVAERAKNKTAAKRARAIAKARQAEADAAVAAARAAEEAARRPSPEAIEAQRRLEAATDLCRRLEALAASGLDEGEAALSEIERAWQTLGSVADETLASRYEAARQSVDEALSRHLADREERTRLAQAAAEASAARRALCEQVDGLAGDGALEGLEQAVAAWNALEPFPAEAEGTRWQRRFDDAVKACQARHRALQAQRANRDKATQVCADIEKLASATTFPDARQPWQALRRAWNEITASGFDDATLAARFNDADARLRTLEAEAREHRAKTQQENLARAEKLCAEIEATVKVEELTLKVGERAVRDARALLDDAGPLPSRQDRDALTERLEAALEKLLPRVAELREMDEWQRWANAGVQEELCQKVEALAQVEDLAQVARQLKELQAHWKQVSVAPRNQSQALWTRFKTAADAARARCDVYFAQVAEGQRANQARKETLCQQAEALAGSTDWIKTADAIKTLQAEWKTVGPAPRAEEKALWDRFHAACNTFFTRRREDLQSRKEEWSANLARKEAICERAEAIAETTEWQKGIEEIKALQAEWKTIGPVRKARADAIWQRFRAACDRFFERYQQRDQLAHAPAIAEADAACQALETLLPAEESEAAETPADLASQVAAARARFGAAVALLPRDRTMILSDRLGKLLSRLVERWPTAFAGTDLDPEVTLREMEELCVQVEQIGAPENGTSATGPTEDESPAAVLARQLREALATNTIAGRPDESGKWKAAADQLKAAQATWKRFGPVPEGAARSLNARFAKACARATERLEQRRRGVAMR
jgi:hypothetical protein